MNNINQTCISTRVVVKYHDQYLQTNAVSVPLPWINVKTIKYDYEIFGPKNTAWKIGRCERSRFKVIPIPRWSMRYVDLIHLFNYGMYDMKKQLNQCQSIHNIVKSELHKYRNTLWTTLTPCIFIFTFLRNVLGIYVTFALAYLFHFSLAILCVCACVCVCMCVCVCVFIHCPEARENHCCVKLRALKITKVLLLLH